MIENVVQLKCGVKVGFIFILAGYFRTLFNRFSIIARSMGEEREGVPRWTALESNSRVHGLG